MKNNTYFEELERIGSEWTKMDKLCGISQTTLWEEDTGCGGSRYSA